MDMNSKVIVWVFPEDMPKIYKVLDDEMEHPYEAFIGKNLHEINKRLVTLLVREQDREYFNNLLWDLALQK